MAERTERKTLGTVTAVKKFGLVGDGTVGKTTILLTYTTQSFVKDYVPTGESCSRLWRRFLVVLLLAAKSSVFFLCACVACR